MDTGTGDCEPALWGLVEEFVGDLWPNGNPGQIHAAATDAGAALVQRFKARKHTLQGPNAVVASQHIPESGLIQQAFSKLGDAMVKIGDESGKLAKGWMISPTRCSTLRARSAICYTAWTHHRVCS